MTDFTADQLGTVKSQVQPPPVGTGPAADDLAAKTAAASATDVDVNALLARLMAQQEAMAAEIERLKAAGKISDGVHPLIDEAEAARSMIGTHFEFHRARAEVTRLADDLVDAAKNAVASGDTAAVRKVAANLTKTLNSFHPGPGDNHYFTLALQLAGYHIPIAADTVTAPQPSNAPAIGGAAPVQVVAGSVTG